MNIFAYNKMLYNGEIVSDLCAVGNTNRVTTPITLSIDINDTTDPELVCSFIKNSDVRAIMFVGDTMKHSRIVEIIDSARKYRIGIHTDPIVWDQDLIDIIEDVKPIFTRIKYKNGFYESYLQIKGKPYLTGCTFYINSKNYTDVGSFMLKYPDVEHIYLSVDPTDPLDHLQTSNVLEQLFSIDSLRFYSHNLTYSLENTKINKQPYDYCFFKDLHVRLKSNGDLVACSQNDTVWGNIVKGDMWNIWRKSKDMRETFNPSEKCGQCINRCKNEAVNDFLKNGPSHSSFL